MNSPPAIDQVVLLFSPLMLVLMNTILALVIFGISLDLKLADFRLALRSPKGLILATVGHHLIFPAMTFGLLFLLQPQPSIALGMILVSSCPAGHLSNFMTHLARGNTALSVSASALSSLLAIVLTPLNFNFWGHLHPITRNLMTTIAIDPWAMLWDITLILGAPLAMGMLVSHRYPQWAKRAQQPMKRFSLIVFGLFVVGALAANFRPFFENLHRVVFLVFVHNAMALGTGYGLSTLVGLGERERRAVTYEMGIQNTALGLILIFNLFKGLGGMAIITGWWAVWHVVTGLTLATYWSKRAPGT